MDHSVTTQDTRVSAAAAGDQPQSAAEGIIPISHASVRPRAKGTDRYACDSCKKGGITCERVEKILTCRACLDSDDKAPCSRTFRKAWVGTSCDQCLEDNMPCRIPEKKQVCSRCEVEKYECSRPADLAKRAKESNRQSRRRYLDNQKEKRRAQARREAAGETDKV